MSAGSDRRLVLRPVRVAIAAAVLAVVVIILLIVLIGPSDEEQITEVTLAYGQADEAAACPYLSTEAFERLGGQAGCEEAFQGVDPVAFEVKSIAIDGDTASAQVLNTAPRGTTFTLGFVEEDGEWKISQFPGLEQPIVPPDQPPPVTESEEPAPEETETETTDTTETETTETTETETEP